MAKILKFGGVADTRPDLPDDVKQRIEQQAMEVGALLAQVKNIEQQMVMMAAGSRIGTAAGKPNQQLDEQFRQMGTVLEKGWLQLADALGMNN